MNPWLIVGIVVGAIFVIAAIYFACGYTKASTDEAIIITGLGKRKILIGKAGMRLPFFQKKNVLSLSLISVDIKTRSSVPTREFININVDAVANIKISSKPELLERAAESLLGKSQEEINNQVIQVLEGNIREIVGSSAIRDMVQDRKGIADKVIANVVPDMEKIGMEVVNFNIQNFTDDNHVIENLGIDNISQISKDAAIAKANANRDVAIAQAQADKEANEANVTSQTTIVEQNTNLALKTAELKVKLDTAKAEADAAYDLEKQNRNKEIAVATTNAEIAKTEREVALSEQQAAVRENQLTAEIKKRADADRYAAETKAQAELFERQKAAEAEKYELEQKAEMQKIQAIADKEAKAQTAAALEIQAKAEANAQIAKAEAAKQAALAEATGIEAKGKAEAEAIQKKADAMKQYGEAATLKLVLDSGIIPQVVEAYSKPMAEAMAKVGNITMYGEGNSSKLVGEMTNNGTQILEGLNNALGIDVKSVISGFLGGSLAADSPKGATTPEVKPVDDKSKK